MAETFSDRAAILARISPASLSANTYTSDVIDMRYWRRVAIILLTGVLGNNGTVQVTVQANTTNSTSGGTNISGKTFTAANFSGSGSGTAGGSLHEGIIEVTDADVKATLNNGRYLYVSLVIGTATSLAAVAIIGLEPRYSPASDFDLSSVREIIQ